MQQNSIIEGFLSILITCKENIKNVPLSELDNFLNDVNKNQQIIMLCQHGNRSELAVEYLMKKGFSNVFHLQNGIESLEKSSNDIR